jgi:GNAT superfamily N-acetyltransferase
MTAAEAGWHIAPLDGKRHDRSSFSCGAAELDQYIREFASQDVRRDVARVFVALDQDTAAITGYYSLSATSFQRETLPADQARRLPRYPVPAALLGRLAVDEKYKGRGLGAYLLMDALTRICLATEVLAVQALIVDARDDSAAAFYRKYGFRDFVDDRRRLFLPMATIRKLVAG